jgi:type IV pilus assembly protein PilQ
MEVIALTLSASLIKIDKIVICFFVLIFFIGCSGDLKSTKKDPFLEKWGTMADSSQGHSPTAKPKIIDIPTAPDKTASTSAVMGDLSRKMPTKPINLTMRQADLKAVLRAMCKAVNYNLLVKNDLKGEVSVDFRNVPWDQAFTGLLKTHGLSYVWEGSIIRVMTIEDIEHELKQKIQLRDIQMVEPLMEPVVIKIDYADPEKLMETLKGFLTKDKVGVSGSVTLDKHTNSLVIYANSRDLARMIPIIEKLDKPIPQILIKANIVETTKSVARDLGIQWGGSYKTGNYKATGGKTAPQGSSGEALGMNFPAALASATPLGSLGLLFGTIGGSLLEVQLQALQQDNKLNILSSPSITTLDNVTAYTENGEKVPYTTQSSGGVGAAPTYSTKFEDVVLRLEITPHVIDGKNLKMKISVKKDEVDTSRKSMLGDPYIVKKTTETVLIVQDGETIVISGLTKQRRLDGDSGFPLFKDIPVLGYLFKADSKSESMEEVLIFITPTILQAASVENSLPATIQNQR